MCDIRSAIAKLKIFCTNVELISAMKLCGFGLGALGWNLRAKFERRGQGATQIGNGIWTRFSLKLTVNDFTYGGPSIMKVKFWSVTFQNEKIGTLQRNSWYRTIRKHGLPKLITTDKLASYSAAFRKIGVAERQLCDGRTNNRCENSHPPFRRRERAMQKFKSCATLQRFASLHSPTYNHFNHERHLETRQAYKQKRCAALSEWFQLCASY